MHRFLCYVAAVVMAAAMVGCESADDGNSGKRPEKTPSYSKEFKFENIAMGHTMFSIDVTPEDESMEYIIYMSEVDYFRTQQIDTPEELFEDDYIYFSEYAETMKMGLHDFLQQASWVATGAKQGFKGVKLMPDTRYVVYCYGVAFDGDSYEPTTDINYVVITTTAPKLESVEFDFEIAVEGNDIDIIIDPVQYDGLYTYYFVSENDPSFIAEDIEEIPEGMLATYRDDVLKRSREQDEENETQLCYEGTTTINRRVMPNTTYMLMCFAVTDDQEPIMSSKPVIRYIKSEGVNYSDMTFDIQVSNITSYHAWLDITPSTDEPYACVFITADQMPDYEDEAMIIESILLGYDPSIFEGKHSEALTPLLPGGSYVVVAFGFDGVSPTTRLFKYEFTTPEQPVSDVVIEDIEILKVYDLAEIAAIDNRYATLMSEENDYKECLVLVKATTNKPCKALYYYWYYEVERDVPSEEAYYEDFLLYEPTPSPTVIPLWYSNGFKEFFFAGIAEDEEGYYSEIYFGEAFELTREMCSPAEEFFTGGVDVYNPKPVIPY